MIVAEGGQAHVVWYVPGQDGDMDIIHRHFNGTAWQPLEEVSTDPMSTNDLTPAVAVDGDDVHFVWADTRGGDWDIYYRRFNGNTWEPEVEVSSDVLAEQQGEPSIAADSGKVHIVWPDGDLDRDIYYRCFNGTGWESEVELSNDTTIEDQYLPRVAAVGDEVHVVWSDKEDGDWDIHYRRYNGSDWEPEQEISTDSGTEDQGRPSIAADGNTAHVTWMDHGDGDWDIYYRRYNGSDWEPEQEISKDVENEDQNGSSIASEAGGVHIVWQNYDPGGILDADIYYRYFNGTDWQSEEMISTDVGGELQKEPSIAVDGNNVWAVWTDKEDGDFDVYLRVKEIDDLTQPNSSVSPISSYWQTTPVYDIQWTASDNEDLSSVTLFYRYSSDNVTWTAWSAFATNYSISGSDSSGSFSFDSPDGEGYYEFYSAVIDVAQNSEMPQSWAEASTGLDIAPPSGSIVINGGGSQTKSTTVTLDLTYTDAISGVSQVRLSNDGVWDTEPWETPSPTRIWNLTGGEGIKTVYYQVKDNAGLISISHQTSIVVSQSLDVLLILSILLALFVGAFMVPAVCVRRYEWLKYGLLMFFLPLYTRLKRETVLDHETRGMIRGYIIANPGDHYSSIKSALGLNNGTLAHHLHILEREMFVKSIRDGRYKRFFPVGAKVSNGAHLTKIQELIVEMISENPGRTQKEIARRIGVTQPAVSYHVNRLIELGKLRAEKRTISLRYFLVESNA
ncbi:MAG: winged helix-turn-helix transcriptional regulator [Methanobacteriota archaeon]|nr:MAG: winged helix-turn-helix transcriptional regulator [Euryarchaeota archaeon]